MPQYRIRVRYKQTAWSRWQWRTVEVEAADEAAAKEKSVEGFQYCFDAKPGVALEISSDEQL